tara:strand:- start:404 stop:505 length:102 start_codon:yes stop_codon:yes gene_type:complete
MKKFLKKLLKMYVDWLFDGFYEEKKNEKNKNKK